MKRYRSPLALLLSASLASLSPGIGVHAVLAQSVAAGVQVPGGANGVLGAAAVPGFSFQGPRGGVSPSMALDVKAPGDLKALTAPGMRAMSVSRGAAAVVQPARMGAPSSLPAAVSAAPGASPSAFAVSIGRAASAGAALIGREAAAKALPGAPGRRSALQSLGREMPDFGGMGTAGAKDGAQSDFMARIGARSQILSGPDDIDDPDELGNPRRRQDDGPDSVSEGSESRDAEEGGVLLSAGHRGGASQEEGLPGPAEAEMDASVDLIVILQGASRPLSNDVHLSLVGRSGSSKGMLKAYQAAQQGMLADLEHADLGQDMLDAFGASPVATYRRINAATLRVAASRAADLKAALQAKGYQVYENAKRGIVQPVRPDEGRSDAPNPSARGALTLPETLKLSTADKVHEVARAKWGAPGADMGLFGRLTLGLLRRLGLLDIPQPQVGVIDTGADTSHKLLRGVKEVKNVTRGENVDDNGHGTWVTSLVLYFAPWLKNVTHYKTFEGGGATLDDILKALTLAGNDGNIIISNSWGSDEGDPDGPDSRLVKKLAEEGRIMVFAAGNAGGRKNTIGSPAIVAHRDPATGAPRVLAVAATDREGQAAYFSSRGKGSPMTSRDPKYKDWPQRPDLAEQGYNTEGAWPANLGPGRVDPELGPLNAISGTSMSTPKVAGTLALLAQLFGVTTVGERLDAVVNAVMKTLVNPRGQGKDDVGEGFNAVYAAYEELAKTLRPAAPPLLARWALRLLAR